MRAIVLAAGEGSRLRPLTGRKPKPMIRVANKPILRYVVEALAANGIQDVTLVLGYHREKVQSYFEDGRRFGVRISYVFQDALLGTAHALSLVPPGKDDVLVLGGDNIVDARLVKDLLAAPPGLALVAKAAENPSKYGVVSLDGDSISRIEEKPPKATSDLVNTGVYRVTPDFHAYLRGQVMKGLLGVTAVLQGAIDSGRGVLAVRSLGTWLDAVYPWDLLALNAHLVGEPVGPPSPAAAGLHSRAVVEGPVILGSEVEVGAQSVILPTTCVGHNVVIGAGCIVENSVVYDDVQIGPGSILRNCVIGEGSRIGPRFTALSGACDVRVRDGWHELPDFGSVIGEDCVIEGGVTIRAGALVGNRARISAGSFVSQNADDGATVVRGG